MVSSDWYDAYGSRHSTAPISDPFGYKAASGYYSDTETGLIYLQHRYYDPGVGRFLNRDPISYAGGINIYGYCGNNPVNFADPSGLQSYDMSNGYCPDPSMYCPDPSIYVSHTVHDEGVDQEKPGSATREAASAVVNEVPGVGNAKAAQEVAIPCDYIAGRRLSTFERVARVPSIVPGLNEFSAEENAGARLIGKSYFRSMSKAEAEAVKKTGQLRGGIPGKTYFTDSRFRSGSRAQDRLSLKTPPEVQMEFRIKNNPSMRLNGTRVKPDNGGRGGGREYMTHDPVKVDPINVQPY